MNRSRDEDVEEKSKKRVAETDGTTVEMKVIDDIPMIIMTSDEREFDARRLPDYLTGGASRIPPILYQSFQRVYGDDFRFAEGGVEVDSSEFEEPPLYFIVGKGNIDKLTEEDLKRIEDVGRANYSIVETEDDIPIVKGKLRHKRTFKLEEHIRNVRERYGKR